MGILKRIEWLFINYIDRYFGKYQYYKGKNNIGRLSGQENIKRIFYLMAPSFGNIGDEAIVEASILFLKDYYPEYEVIVIDFDETYQMIKEIERIISNNDIIFLQGGGNIGTLYYDAEVMREFIIRKFMHYKIVSMPQSLFFVDNNKGRKRFEKCIKTYNKHNDLTIIAREKYSYELMKSSFHMNKILLNPDIVFYYSSSIDYINSYDKSGIMICLRSDKESVLGKSRQELIINIFENFNNVFISDTFVGRRTPDPIRRYEVKSLIHQFNKSQLIITDRLHGMVFAAITNTPCIVLPSLDNKVLGTYEWISNLDYIFFMNKDQMSYIVDLVKQMLNKHFTFNDWSSFRQQHYSSLRQRIDNP